MSATEDITARFTRGDGTYDPRLDIRHSTSGTDIRHTYSTSANNLSFSIASSKFLNIDSNGSITTPNSAEFNGTIGSSANLGSAVFPSGHIIQTENIATTSTFTPGSISSGTFVDSGFSDTITPKRTDTKLLVNFCGTVSCSSDVWIYIALQFSGSSITTQTVGESGTTPLIRTNPRGGS